MKLEELPVAEGSYSLILITSCPKCKRKHPYIIGYEGDIVRLLPAYHRDPGGFAKKMGVKEEDLKAHHIFICFCGQTIHVR